MRLLQGATPCRLRFRIALMPHFCFLCSHCLQVSVETSYQCTCNSLVRLRLLHSSCFQGPVVNGQMGVRIVQGVVTCCCEKGVLQPVVEHERFSLSGTDARFVFPSSKSCVRGEMIVVGEPRYVCDLRENLCCGNCTDASVLHETECGVVLCYFRLYLVVEKAHRLLERQRGGCSDLQFHLSYYRVWRYIGSDILQLHDLIDYTRPVFVDNLRNSIPSKCLPGSKIRVPGQDFQQPLL